MNPHSYAHLIFDKGTKNIWWTKDSLFNKCCWKKWLSACRKLNLDPCLSPCSSINSDWINYLNIRLETLHLVQERARNTLEAIGIGKDFLIRTHVAQQLRERMDKWDYKKLRSSVQQSQSNGITNTCVSLGWVCLSLQCRRWVGDLSDSDRAGFFYCCFRIQLFWFLYFFHFSFYLVFISFFLIFLNVFPFFLFYCFSYVQYLGTS
jgi:hypothetical protein